MTKGNVAENIDAYISQFPANVQEMLQLVRTVIRDAAPAAVEKISYQIPTFSLNGNLVHFAAFKNHVGFYGVPTGDSEFKEGLSAYKEGKGSLRLPIGKPVPVDLITKIVKFRVKRDVEKAEAKVKLQQSSK